MFAVLKIRIVSLPVKILRISHWKQTDILNFLRTLHNIIYFQQRQACDAILSDILCLVSNDYTPLLQG